MRIYAFGARPPIENAEIVRQQLSLAHSYQCALVAIERDRRAAIDALYIAACPAEWTALEEAEKRSRAAAENVGRCRSTGGDMLPPDEEMLAERKEALTAAKNELEAARENEKKTRGSWWEARRRATPALRPSLTEVDAASRAANKRAYNLAGDVNLAWGTRLKIGEFVERAAKASAKIGTLPKFPRFDGGGAIAVQLQGPSGIEDKKGLSPANAFGDEDTRFRIKFISAAEWQALQNRNSLVSRKGKPLPQPDPNSKRSLRRAAATGGTSTSNYAVVRLRIGSDGRAPVWAAWPVVISRPLPADAPIKWAQIHAHKVGSRTEWRLLITVDNCEVPKKNGQKTVAVNLGWRNLQDGGLRVGYAVGSDGREEEVRVPEAYVRGVAHVDSIRGIRDKRLEELKKDLAEWADERELPEWLEEALRYVDQWKSPKRIAMLLRRWSERRFEKDASLYDALRAWEKQDRHLRFWECDEREKLLRMRKDYYRQIAATLAKEYDRVLITNMDLRDFVSLPAPEEAAKSEGAEQRRSRFLAAPSELRESIKNACSTRGAVFEEVDSKFKTQTCNACGLVTAFAARTDLHHTCECGARWDQDANHCRNLLASDEVVSKTRDPLAPSVTSNNDANNSKKGRWQKRRSKNSSQNIDNKKENK
jgi:hypothetical protein